MRRPFAKIVRRYWVIAVVFLALVGWGGWRIAGLPMFRLSALHVSTLAHVSRAQIVGAARIDPQSNVWFLNRTAIERRIETIPYVDRARVSVRPPAVVTLDVSERTIDGCVRDGALHASTIDETRHVVAIGCPSTTIVYDLAGNVSAAPGTTIRDTELAVLMNDRKALASSGNAYRALSHDKLGELQATLGSGVVVKFGEDTDLDRKERLVGPIIAALGNQGRAIAGVDVRVPDTPVVDYRPAPKTTAKPVIRPNAHHLDSL